MAITTNKMLRLCSYNCIQGHVLDCCDMSHWLLPSESHLWVNDIHSDFVGFGCSAVNISRNLLTGHPYGGVACLSDIAASVSMTKGLDNDRLPYLLE